MWCAAFKASRKQRPRIKRACTAPVGSNHSAELLTFAQPLIVDPSIMQLGQPTSFRVGRSTRYTIFGLYSKRAVSTQGAANLSTRL